MMNHYYGINHSKSTSVHSRSLNQFSSELQCRLNDLRAVNVPNINAKLRSIQPDQSSFNKENKQRSLNNSLHVELPCIKPIKKYKKKPRQVCLLPEIESVASKIRAQMEQVEREQQKFMDIDKYKQIFMYQSPPSPAPIHKIMSVPQYFPMPMPMTIPMPIPMPMLYGGAPGHQAVEGHNAKPMDDKSRKKMLVRKMRVAFMAVYFMFIYQTYSYAVRNIKYERFDKIQRVIIEDFEGLSEDLLGIVLGQDFFQKFLQSIKESEEQISHMKKKPKLHTLVVDGDKISMTVDSISYFLTEFLDDLYERIESGELIEFVPIFVQFLNKEYAYDDLFLKEEISIMEFLLPFRKMDNIPEVSRLLIINFLFIKILVNQMLCNKALINLLYENYQEDPKLKKMTLLYGKKLTIAIILLYKAINSLFFEEVNNVRGNAAKLRGAERIDPMDPLQYQNQKEANVQTKQEQKYELIKQIIIKEEMQEEFQRDFEENMEKILMIGELFYQMATEERKQQLKLIKEEVLDQFPPRHELHKGSFKQFITQWEDNPGPANLTEAAVAFDNLESVQMNQMNGEYDSTEYESSNPNTNEEESGKSLKTGTKKSIFSKNSSGGVLKSTKKSTKKSKNMKSMKTIGKGGSSNSDSSSKNSEATSKGTYDKKKKR